MNENDNIRKKNEADKLKKKKVIREEKKVVVETVVKQETPVAEEIKETKPEIDIHSEDPNAAFPSMLAEVGDADAEFASSFTYENLQDSMLTSGREARDAVKSRAPWSRFGSRANPELWEQQMSEMKKEIKASGQTIEQFMENSWAPIPEQMAAFWKDNEDSSQIPEVRGQYSSAPSRVAMSEAPALTRDATQEIGTNESVAFVRMNEILDARKRAKSLKLDMPPISKGQRADLVFWSSSKDLKFVGVAKSILNF